ncbi:MAG: hypothetical protein RIR62_2359 [Pseudomonadota bacterium]|jgi:hypothetical protein
MTDAADPPLREGHGMNASAKPDTASPTGAIFSIAPSAVETTLRRKHLRASLA